MKTISELLRDCQHRAITSTVQRTCAEAADTIDRLTADIEALRREREQWAGVANREDEWWHYSINYGPDGEENYANVYAHGNVFVGNLRTHHARTIVSGLNEAALRQSESAESLLAKALEGWEDADSAPRDGTEFIACNIGFAPFSCQFWQGEFVHFEPDDGPIYYKFEKWRPFPPSARALVEEIERREK